MPDFIALPDARAENLASVSYHRLIVFRVEMADAEDVVGMIQKVGAVGRGTNPSGLDSRLLLWAVDPNQRKRPT